MGETVTELPDECDFCDRWLEEDEDLVPIFIGGPPEPKPWYVKEVVDKPNTDVFVLGKTAGEWKALLKGLESQSGISVSTSEFVDEVTPENVRVSGQTEHFDTPPVSRRDDKAGATVKIEANTSEPKPDLQVCEFCAKSIKNEPRD